MNQETELALQKELAGHSGRIADATNYEINRINELRQTVPDGIEDSLQHAQIWNNYDQPIEAYDGAFAGTHEDISLTEWIKKYYPDAYVIDYFATTAAVRSLVEQGGARGGVALALTDPRSRERQRYEGRLHVQQLCGDLFPGVLNPSIKWMRKIRSYLANNYIQGFDVAFLNPEAGWGDPSTLLQRESLKLIATFMKPRSSIFVNFYGFYDWTDTLHFKIDSLSNMFAITRGVGTQIMRLDLPNEKTKSQY